MRVLAITSLYPNPYQPGLAAFNRQRFRLLSERLPVAILSPIAWTVEFSARRAGRPALPPGRICKLDGPEVHHPRYFYPPGFWRRSYGAWFRLAAAKEFHRLLRSFRPDLIFSPWIYPDGLAAVRLGHGAGLPVILMAHGSDILALDSAPGRRPGTARAVREADAVVAVSRDLAKAIVALGASPDRVHVQHDGVDLSRFRPGPRPEARVRLGLGPDGPPIVLAVGNLLPVKGLDILLDAFARMAAAGVSFCGVLIGGGPLDAALRRRIDFLGLQSRVELLGPKPHESLSDWYRAASVLALPSRSEGVPTVLLEATASGLPFVASRVGGVPEVADLGRGILVPAGDPIALAEALARSLAGPLAPPHGGIRPSRGADEAVDELIGLFEGIAARHRAVASNMEAAPVGAGLR